MEPTGFGPDFWELTRKPRLLVVEDDNDIGNLLKLCFTDQGMDVTVTVMGREGLALFSTQLFDLVMLDVNLPDIDGFEVMRGIRTSKDRNVPVYFLTQKDQRADKLDGAGAGRRRLHHQTVRDRRAKAASGHRLAAPAELPQGHGTGQTRRPVRGSRVHQLQSQG